MKNGFSIEGTTFSDIRAKIEAGYGSTEPLATNKAAEQQKMIDNGTFIFMLMDQDGDGNIDIVEFSTKKPYGWSEEESRNLFDAISENGKISPKRFGAFCNVRETGDGAPQDGIVSGEVNDKLIEVAQKGPNTLGFINKPLGFKNLTLGQAIDLVQYGEIKYATTEQIDKGYLKLVKKEE